MTEMVMPKKIHQKQQYQQWPVVGVSSDGTAETSMLEPDTKSGNLINENTKHFIDINSLCVPHKGHSLK